MHSPICFSQADTMPAPPDAASISLLFVQPTSQAALPPEPEVIFARTLTCGGSASLWLKHPVFRPFLTACLWMATAAFSFSLTAAAPTFTVGTYNVENYLDLPKGTRAAKSQPSKDKVRETIKMLNADILAIQEMGSLEAFDELQHSLRSEGLHYPHREFVRGWDTNIFVCVLSRFAITARRPRTNESFLLNGRRLHVSRGFAEVDIRVNPSYEITLMTAHLKSRRAAFQADESEWREQEALKLRSFIEARLAASPRANLVVLGDFNDTPDSRSIRALIGKGKTSLADTRPTEMNGDSYADPESRYEPRRIAWTHFYAKEDTFSRIDYILVSRGMAAEWQKAGTRILTMPNWGLASDHRPIVATFTAQER